VESVGTSGIEPTGDVGLWRRHPLALLILTPLAAFFLLAVLAALSPRPAGAAQLVAADATPTGVVSGGPGGVAPPSAPVPAVLAPLATVSAVTDGEEPLVATASSSGDRTVSVAVEANRGLLATVSANVGRAAAPIIESTPLAGTPIAPGISGAFPAAGQQARDSSAETTQNIRNETGATSVPASSAPPGELTDSPGDHGLSAGKPRATGTGSVPDSPSVPDGGARLPTSPIPAGADAGDELPIPSGQGNSPGGPSAQRLLLPVVGAVCVYLRRTRLPRLLLDQRQPSPG